MEGKNINNNENLVNIDRNKIEGINFKEVFDAKFASIKPLSWDESADVSSNFMEYGINVIEKKAPCIIFYQRKDISLGYNIWVEDPKNCDKRFPHDDVYDKFLEFQENKKVDFAIGQLSAYVMKDNLGRKYLLFGALQSKGVGDWFKKYEEIINSFKDLIQRYGIEKVLGQFINKREEVVDDRIIETIDFNPKIVNLLENDLMGRIRENSYLFSFAEKYKMTNSQFMRFRIRAISNRQAALTDKDVAIGGVLSWI